MSLLVVLLSADGAGRTAVRLELARADANLMGHDLIRRAVQRSLDRPGVAVPRPGGGGGAATAADGGRRSSSSAASAYSWAEQLTLACSLTNTFDSSGCARARCRCRSEDDDACQ